MSLIRPSADDLSKASDSSKTDGLLKTLKDSPELGSMALMTSELFLRHRLKMVEDLWESVLRQECGQNLVDLLNQLLDLCSPEGQAADTSEESEALKVVEKLELNDAIRAARAFALYFQLINIVEQHYEQRDQQQQYRAARDLPEEDDRPPSYWDLGSSGETTHSYNSLEADDVEQPKRSNPPQRRATGTFQWLFPRLKQLNVPPQQIQKLLQQLEVWLVFTAHPTEIVRHTIRDCPSAARVGFG
jgi:phosphoenolpyruvate carboxylase